MAHDDAPQDAADADAVELDGDPLCSEGSPDEVVDDDADELEEALDDTEDDEEEADCEGIITLGEGKSTVLLKGIIPFRECKWLR